MWIPSLFRLFLWLTSFLAQLDGIWRSFFLSVFCQLLIKLMSRPCHFPKAVKDVAFYSPSQMAAASHGNARVAR
jgi:hypothetical protein